MTFLDMLPPGIKEKLRLHYEKINSSIYLRVRFVTLALTLSILLIVGILSFGFMRHLVKLNIRKTVESDAVQASQKLEHTMNSISESMTNLSKNLIIINAIVDTIGRETYITPFMKSFKLQHDINVKLTLCDFMGMPIASNVKDPGKFNTPELLQKTIEEGKGYAKLLKSDNGGSILMAFPVIWVMTNKPEGILVAEVGINEMFSKTLPDFDALSDRSLALLSGGDRVIKKNMNTKTIFFRMKRSLKLNPPLDTMSFQLEIFDHREINLAWLPGIYFILGAVFIALALRVSRAISLRLTDRLTVLSNTARQIAQSGSLDLAADVKGTDEIKALSLSFNAMVEKVREAHAHLERRVEERTAQLFQSNEVLSREIGEKEQIEQTLRKSEQFTRNILDTVDEGFIVVDRNYRILTANKAYCSQVGGCDEEIIGEHCYRISHRINRPCFEAGEECAVRQVFESGKPATAVHKHSDTKGSILYVETKAFPIMDSSGTVVSVIETVNNITEKHLLEVERLKTQKLEAIGALAGGIAHDFNNLLQGVFGYISIAKIYMDRKHRSFEMLEQAEQALRMSVNLTSQLLTFSKGGRPVKQKMQVQPIIKDAIKFALSGSAVDYHLTFDDNLWTVEADEGQIGQVIQNIVLNSVQAMPMGGTIKIAAVNLQGHKKKHLQLPGDKKYIQVSVHDNGIGIPEEYLLKIFDPYFTTKEKGSGLGLATSYSIIKNHGGVIDAASKPGEGTTFCIYLPAVEATVEAQVRPVVSHAVRRAKVLLMDDEELVRNIAAEMMSALGHTVEFAENGETAIEKYTSSMKAGKPFEIVILDLTIRGGMGGKETIHRLREIDPGVRAIVSSGYSEDAVVSEYYNYGFRERLSKPYELRHLRDTINTLLDS